MQSPLYKTLNSSFLNSILHCDGIAGKKMREKQSLESRFSLELTKLNASYVAKQPSGF